MSREDFIPDPAELAESLRAAEANRESMRGAARALFTPQPSGDLFAGYVSPRRINIVPRTSTQLRDTARGLFTPKPTRSALEERLRGIDPKELDQ